MADSRPGADEPAVARAAAAAAPPDGGSAETLDGFFGGRLLLRQPARGQRSGTDAVLLAAAAPRGFAGLACDAGAGTGAVGLGVALLCPAARVVLVEREAAVAGLAAANALANGFGDRVDVVRGDLLAGGLLAAPADLVLTNPPFYEASRSRPSPVAARRAGHVLDPAVTLTDWLGACLALLAPRGTLILVQAPDAVPEALAALRGRAGAITVKPVHPRAGTPARRVLLRAVKGSRAPFALAAPLVLHDGPAFTPEAELVHRGEALLDW